MLMQVGKELLAEFARAAFNGINCFEPELCVLNTGACSVPPGGFLDAARMCDVLYTR